jgi:SAM-dependent methyltransferase
MKKNLFEIAGKAEFIAPNVNLPNQIYYDFGCGFNKRPGYIGVDINPNCNPDILGDLANGIPEIASDKADYICSLHALEHVNQNTLIKSLEEISRILKSKGKWEIRVPHCGSDTAMMPGHIHVIPPAFFWDLYKLEEFKHGSLSKIQVDKILITPNDEAYGLSKQLNISLELVIHHFRNVSEEIVILGHKI